MQTKYLCVLIHIWIKGEVGAPLNWFKPSSKIFTDRSKAVRGVPEGKIKVRRGWVWEGVSPSHTLGKKSKYELNGGFSCIFWT